MHEELKELYELLQRDRARSPRSRRSTFESSLRELRAELAELDAAYAQGDDPMVANELGDVLWVVLFLLILGEESNAFTPQHVIAGSIAKLKRRKPWLLGDEIPSPAEEERLWTEGKLKERSRS